MLSTTERLARFETAQEIIGMMISMRAEWIDTELAKPRPDQAKVQGWAAEQTRHSAEEDALRPFDDRAIDRVLA